LLLALAFPVAGRAQEGLSPNRSGDARLELPAFEPPHRQPGRILPPVSMPRESSRERLSAGLRVFVTGYRFSGNTALSDSQLGRIAAPFSGREVSFADLEVLRDRLTLAYVRRGYVSSGALLPEQRVQDGIVHIQIVEGVLADLEIHTDGRFRESYLRERLEPVRRGVVNVNQLERRLQTLQRDSRVRRLRAELAPGDLRGESRLRLWVEERKPYWARLGFDNYRAPSIGSQRGQLEFGYSNLTGFGDALELGYAGSPGAHDVGGRYEIPISRRDTRIALRARGIWSEIVEDPFGPLDVRSQTQSYGISLHQPVYHSIHDAIELSLAGEWRRSKTSLLGIGVPFGEGSSQGGVSKVSVLRLGVDWMHRGRSQVVAARSTLSWGIDALGATVNTGDTPDGRFLVWLGQAQWARRLGFLDLQLILREDIQLSNAPLLSLEQFSVGGHATVRGYRENALVRDNGLVGSIELRMPLIERSGGRPAMELAPFLEHAYAWNRDRPTSGPKSLFSAGLGLRFAISERARAQAYWGQEIRQIEDDAPWDLQDSGFHFRLEVELP
jgi:hemolysin activation/secretion protein